MPVLDLAEPANRNSSTKTNGEEWVKTGRLARRCSRDVVGHVLNEEARAGRIEQDGGELVRKLYGHPDARLARERVREAFRQAPAPPVPIPLLATGR